ncbi:MAG TPA: SDR family oxidoreductase [Sphingomicrobium sp.]|nr:SDR family oxidoreductase [Sphingomicrobium sp.]
MADSGDLQAVYPSLQGKRVLVTGGGSGIGAGIVEAFTRQGSDVTFIDILNGESQAVAEKTGARFERVDLKDIKLSTARIQSLVERDGPFHVLVNNAANDDRHKLADVTEEYWDDRLSVNLKHQFFCAQAVVPGMRQAGGGAIVNLGSISWHLALPDLVLYQTCKAAIEGLTRALARDLGEDNIRVNCVVPGNIRTPRQMQWYTPEGEAAILDAQCINCRLEPRDVAALVTFLSSDDARGMTGHEHFVDAGWR